MTTPEVVEPVTKRKITGLFVLTVIFGLTFLGSVTVIKQIVNHEFFWCGIHGVFVEFGFFIANILGIILTGFITALIFRKFTDSHKDLLVISACSGCVTGTVWLLGRHFFSVVYEYQLGHYITGTAVWDIFPRAFTHFFWSSPLMFLILLAIMGLEITGSLIFTYCDRTPEEIPSGKEIAGRKPIRVRTAIMVITIAILLSMVLPLWGGMAAVRSGTIPYSFCAPTNPVAVQVTRSDNSTIILQLSLDYSGHARDRSIPVTSQPLRIMIDDRDFSNQSLIRQQGFSDTIYPQEGITQYAHGVSVTLSGPEIAWNESPGRHIYAISYYDQKNPWVVADTHV